MHEINSIGIVGAGQMGRGIAQTAIQHDFVVQLFDVSAESLKMAQQFIKEQLDKGVVKNKWTKELAEKAFANLHLHTGLEGLKNCDLIIEAATENIALKKDIFRQLDALVLPHTILASNTSSISITEIAAVTKRPTLIAGMHFMNPVPVMKLVEGIKGLETSEQTFQTIQKVAESMGKIFVSVRDIPGFAVNRILMPMINEAIYVLYEGIASATDIDQSMKLGTNQPMGPLELADFIGLDTCLAIMEVIFKGMGDTKYRPCPLLKQYVAAGRLGKKVKRGFYDYP